MYHYKTPSVLKYNEKVNSMKRAGNDVIMDSGKVKPIKVSNNMQRNMQNSSFRTPIQNNKMTRDSLNHYQRRLNGSDPQYEYNMKQMTKRGQLNHSVELNKQHK